MSLAYHLAADSPPADAVKHLYQKTDQGGWQLDVSGLPLPADLPTNQTDDQAGKQAGKQADEKTTSDETTEAMRAGSVEQAGQGAGTPLPQTGGAGPAVLARHDSGAINRSLVQLARGEAMLAS